MRWLVFITLVSVVGCTKPKADFMGVAVPLETPLGLPPVPDPAPAAAVALGKSLFFSPALSVDGSVACATCHQPEKGFADPRAGSEGVKGARGNRNAPSVWNAVYQRSQFWDGRAKTLEEQASGPMLNANEMGHTSNSVVASVKADPKFLEMVAAAYGDDTVTMERIAKALAAYERILVRGNSPFDRFVFGGDQAALSDEAKRGLELFRGKANCATCHVIGKDYALFTDHQFHNLGVGMDATGELTDLGRFKITGQERDKGAFRTPSLRNIAETAPYMHDGSLKTLKEVVDFYVGGGNANPQLDPLLRPLTMFTRQERADLVVFLESLTGEVKP